MSRLVEEMNAAWQRGERVPAEEFLARHPEAGGDKEAVVRLVYEEICLRQEAGEPDASLQVIGRFPQWQTELQVMRECHRLLAEGGEAPAFPAPGEALGEFHLLAELGRGANGRVYLALQSPLEGRPVVLKVTPRGGREHLALARLQHTHIVPLYAVHDFPDRNLRGLCMPYLGGTTLDRLLARLRETPPARRSGRHLVDALDRARPPGLVSAPPPGPARPLLARSAYAEAVCRIGACLADALHYAHARGLLHLDLKPSNLLLAADGEPLLLDFHLAREPLAAGASTPAWFGGSPGYMSPEQEAALAAVSRSRPVPYAVDARSDVYSLGLVLAEALAGAAVAPPPPLRLSRRLPHVSVGLADIIDRCLEPDAAARYPSAAALGDDLRRHLADLPLRGVANRSPAERWRKWRRRRPHAVGLAALLLAVLVTAGAAAAGAAGRTQQRLRQAEAALADGQRYFQRRQYREAAEASARGLALAQGSLGGADLSRALARDLRRARRAQAADELHAAAEQLRFLVDPEVLAPPDRQAARARCHDLWQDRACLLDGAGAELGPEVEQRIRDDLLDLALLWADLHVRLAPASQAPQARQQADELLAQAEALFGPSPALSWERRRHAARPDPPDPAGQAGRPLAHPARAWDHYVVGRALLRSGDAAAADRELGQAVALQPQGFWPLFCHGVCAYRLGRHEDAVAAFTACVALAPRCGPCYHNRALAQAALGRIDRALRDYGHALEHAPGLSAAALNRGLLHYRERRYDQALADLHLALDRGADPAAAYYNLALVHLARQDGAAARSCVRKALRHDPGHGEAQALEEHLRQAQ